jgi:hypothetical protein
MAKWMSFRLRPRSPVFNTHRSLIFYFLVSVLIYLSAQHTDPWITDKKEQNLSAVEK